MIKFPATRKFLVNIKMYNFYGAPAEDQILKSYFRQKLTFQNSNMVNYKEMGIKRKLVSQIIIICLFHVQNFGWCRKRAILTRRCAKK